MDSGYSTVRSPDTVVVDLFSDVVLLILKKEGNFSTTRMFPPVYLRVPKDLRLANLYYSLKISLPFFISDFPLVFFQNYFSLSIYDDRSPSKTVTSFVPYNEIELNMIHIPWEGSFPLKPRILLYHRRV